MQNIENEILKNETHIGHIIKVGDFYVKGYEKRPTRSLSFTLTEGREDALVFWEDEPVTPDNANFVRELVDKVNGTLIRVVEKISMTRTFATPE